MTRSAVFLDRDGVINRAFIRDGTPCPPVSLRDLEILPHVPEALRALKPNERPFVITRAAYAGIQRYSMVWTGDNHSTWEQFELSIRQCLNLSLSGVPFCGPDVGGFSWDCTGELLARWTQAGAFFPFFRNHTAQGTRRQEPWTFGKKIEVVCREAIRLRYRLMPYIYNLFREAMLDGTPIMRPLFWEFPDDPNAYAIDDQFLLGPSLLVAPVLKPGATTRAVYLPAGDWYDYRTKQRLEGGRYFGADAPLEVIPVFVRAGTILPVESAPIVMSYMCAGPQLSQPWESQRIHCIRTGLPSVAESAAASSAA